MRRLRNVRVSREQITPWRCPQVVAPTFDVELDGVAIGDSAVGGLQGREVGLEGEVARVLDPR